MDNEKCVFINSIHTEDIKGISTQTEIWRVNERMKTLSVLLILCINPHSDLSDLPKSRYTKEECWMDPLTIPPAKTLECIGQALKQQYERWQPRARYKIPTEITVEEIKKLCISIRRSTKQDRVLFHYNGHGVPPPTFNGEIWVFNKDFSQYIPLPICDILIWLESPTIFVWDCHKAGKIVEKYNETALMRHHEFIRNHSGIARYNGITSYAETSIHLAACTADQMLPSNDEMPEDIFTACLTTPIKISVKWFCIKYRNSLPWTKNISPVIIDKLPGKFSDRRSFIGELNWVFTAITDTIAWILLPRELFLRLFRQDLLLASIFRNYLLAECIMRHYGCTTISHPELPSTYNHFLWSSWESTIHSLIEQLIIIIEQPNVHTFNHSSFFDQQLEAFSNCVQMCTNIYSPPEQLPILLQVFLSQSYRLQALHLLCSFMNFGSHAVYYVLSVGIFPYVLKLLQSTSHELKRLMVFIWSKILSVEPNCKTDLVKENCYDFFISILIDTSMDPEYRAMSAFILSAICNDFEQGHELCLSNDLCYACCMNLVQCPPSQPFFQKWLCLCLSRFWRGSSRAKSAAFRNSAHKNLFPLLSCNYPEVRAAGIQALISLLQYKEDSEIFRTNCLAISSHLFDTLKKEGSPLVKREIVIAFGYYIALHEESLNEYLVDLIKDRTISLETSSLNGQQCYIFRFTINLNYFPLIISSSNRYTYSFTNSQSIFRKCEKNSTNSMDENNTTRIRMANMSLFECDDIDVDIDNDIDSFESKKSTKIRTNIKDIFHSLLYLTIDSDLIISSSAKSILLIYYVNACNYFYPKKSTNVKITKDQIISIKFSLTNNFIYNLEYYIVIESNNNNNKNLSIETEFYAWSCKYFTSSNSYINNSTNLISYRELYYCKRNKYYSLIKNTSKSHQISENDKFTLQLSLKSNNAKLNTLAFHPYEFNLALADEQQVQIYDYFEYNICKSSLHLVPSLSFTVNYNSTTKINKIEYINSHVSPLLLIAQNNGYVTVWRNIEFLPDKDSHLKHDLVNPVQVCGWKALPSIDKSCMSENVILSWQQKTGGMYISGKMPFIYMWDLAAEKLAQTIPVPGSETISAMAHHPQHSNLLLIGTQNGFLHLLDMRNNFKSATASSWRLDINSILYTNFYEQNFSKVFAATSNDTLAIYDINTKSYINKISSRPNQLNQISSNSIYNILAYTCSNMADIFFYNIDDLSYIFSYRTISCQNKHGSIPSILSFHPIQPLLAYYIENDIIICGSSINFNDHNAHRLC